MLQDTVYLRESDHKYFNRETGKELISWSKFSELFSEKFDAVKTAKYCVGTANYIGMSEADIIASWDGIRDKASGHGTRIHDALEYYGKNYSIMEGCDDLQPLINSVFAEYKEFYRRYPEEVLFTKHGIAGKCDNLFIVSPHKNSTFDIEDFKTNLTRGIEYFPRKGNKYFFAPIDHLSYCTYNKYALQLSMYAYMYEEMSGRKCRALRIRYIPPQDMLQHVTIPVPYLKHEIEMMIATYKNR